MPDGTRTEYPIKWVDRKSVWKEIAGGEDELEIGKRKVASRAYVSWFNFKGWQQQRKVGTLSGGEHNRVHLA
jgi:ATPase subunit of ABC transporter with duplicated ATPase domains